MTAAFKVPKSDTVSDLDLAGVAAQVRALRDANGVRDRANVTNLIEMGKLLKPVRDQLPHGQWLPWLTAEFKWTERTAQRCIKIYKLSLVVDLTGCDISMNALYEMVGLRATQNASPADLRGREEAMELIAAEARAQHVSGTRARAIIQARFHACHHPRLADGGPADSTERASMDAEPTRLLRREKAVHRVVKKELATDFGMQAFIDAAQTMPPEQLSKLIMKLCEVLDAQTGRRFNPEGDPDFDAVAA